MKKSNTVLLAALCAIAIAAQAQCMAYAKHEDLNLRERLRIPEQYTVRLVSPSGKLKVNTDMTMEIPDVQTMPAVNVTQHTFSQSDLDKLIAALRKKLGLKDEIKSLPKIGYRLEE